MAALDSTFERKPFNNILHLIPIAENVMKLTAVCHNCKDVANFSRRKIAND